MYAKKLNFQYPNTDQHKIGQFSTMLIAIAHPFIQIPQPFEHLWPPKNKGIKIGWLHFHGCEGKINTTAN